jgi:hypothetical protein
MSGYGVVNERQFDQHYGFYDVPSVSVYWRKYRIPQNA